MTGFLVVAGLALVCVFLFRSMAKHLRKVPETFTEPPEGTPPPDAPPSPLRDGD